uniref:Thioredoxin domain-containing protein n=1 Tax=Ditylenchus dipsaci TaxID=166011 RepID=A0A915E5K5_9BILA
MSELFKDVTLLRNGTDETFKGEDVLKDKKVAIYFSAHWCGPCRSFTPMLKTLFEESTKGSNLIEIVFVSFDRSEEEMLSYIKDSHPDWLYLPFDHPFNGEKGKLAEKYGTNGIPCLKLINPSGYENIEDLVGFVYEARSKANVKLYKAWMDKE